MVSKQIFQIFELKQTYKMQTASFKFNQNYISPFVLNHAETNGLQEFQFGVAITGMLQRCRMQTWSYRDSCFKYNILLIARKGQSLTDRNYEELADV